MNIFLKSVVLTPFVLMQASVVAFLWLHGRHEKAFRQAFYVFFMTATIADCLFVVLGQVELSIEYVAGSKDPDGWIHSGASLAHVVEGFLRALKHGQLIAMVYQPLVHTIIAANRLTAFAFPLRHSMIWSRRAAITAGMTTVAIMFVGIPSVYIGVLHAVDPTAGHYGDLAWGDEATIVTLLYRALLLLACSVAAFALNIVTLAMFILHRRSNKMSHAQRGQDVRLFVHSLVQAFLSLHTFTRTTNQLWMFTEFGASISWVPKWLSLNSREWFAGDPNCTGTVLGDAAAVLVGQVPGAKPCGTVYMILSGQQSLFGSIEVETLTHYLFSLSGGPFLLLVSGTVRRGYIQFYFKRWQRRNNKVIQVAPSTSTKRSTHDSSTST